MKSLLVLLTLALFLSGCTKHIKAQDRVDLSIKKGPPCKIVLSVDGEMRLTVTGKKSCEVN